jgi:phenylpropionate dioxygenase-like ring-hydroxylating dioxygenase large terminal subunit
MNSEDLNVQAALDALPPLPVGWTFFCTERELDRGPVACETMQGSLVAFRTKSGQIGILDARCQHLGADLSRGRVVTERLECPYHRWQYDVHGGCDATLACQSAYPGTQRHGLVFAWNGPKPAYPLPFFDGLDAAQYTCSRPLLFDLKCPWYLIGANSFDTQHLYSVHGRVLMEPPRIEHHGEYALRSRTVSKVLGRGWYDQFIRTVSGPVGTMTATNWSGSLVLVQVSFARTMTLGMVSLRPASAGRTLVHVFSVMQMSQSRPMRKYLDPLRTATRRYFIAQFLKDDSQKLDGISSGPLELTNADGDLVAYFRWLARTSNGLPATAELRVLDGSNLLRGTSR